MRRRGPVQWGFPQLEWLSYQFRGREKFGHQCFLLELEPGTSDEVVQRAIDLMVERHETLRTTFGRDAHGNPEQVVWAPAPVRIQHYSADSGMSPKAFRNSMDKTPFDVGREFPLRVGRIGDRLNLVIAHIAIDGWGAQILGREFEAALAAFRAGVEPDLPEPGPQPLDQAEWERSTAGERLGAAALDFWRDELTRRPARFFPVPALPEAPGYFEVRLRSPAAGLALRHLNAAYSVPPNAVFGATMAVVLAEMFGQDLVPMTMTWAARERPRSRSVVGSLFRDIFVTVDVTDRPPLPVVVKQTYQRILRAGMKSQFDVVRYAEVEAEVGAARGARLRSGLFVNFRPFDDDPAQVVGAPSPATRWDLLLARGTLTTTAVPPQPREYELHVAATPTAEGLVIEATGCDVVFDAEGLRRMLRAVEASLVALLTDGDVAAASIAAGLDGSRVEPGPDWAFTDHTWVNLPVVERLLLAHPDVRHARVSPGPSGLLARVATADTGLLPEHLRRTVLAQLDLSTAAICPASFEVHLDESPVSAEEPDWTGLPVIAVGGGLDPPPRGPSDDAERALRHAVVTANGLPDVDLHAHYVTAGGSLNRAPLVTEALTRAGFSLAMEDFLRPGDLAAMARRCRPSDRISARAVDDPAGPRRGPAATADPPSVLFITNGLAEMQVGGAALRCAALAAALAETARVTRASVACTATGPCPHASPDDPSPYPQWVVRAAPFHATYCPAAAANLVATADRVRPDVVIASGLECGAYLRIFGDEARCARVLDLHNIDSPLYAEISATVRARPDRSHFTTFDGASLATVESMALSWVDQVWTCTDLDRSRLAALHGFPSDRVTVVPNAVAVPGPLPAEPPAVGHVFYVGRLDWFPNVQAAEFVLDELRPHLLRRGVSLPYTIAGGNPARALRDRALPDDVRLLADPPDITDLWAGAVLVVPLRIGGGSRLKILEAFAAGCPVVSTAKGIEGISAVDRRHYLLAETAEQMADAVAELRADPALRISLTRNAHRLVAETYQAGQLVAPIAADLYKLAGRAA
nr:condensation domain-containing protein [Micromonospora sp. DSM 115978]